MHQRSAEQLAARAEKTTGQQSAFGGNYYYILARKNPIAAAAARRAPKHRGRQLPFPIVASPYTVYEYNNNILYRRSRLPRRSTARGGMGTRIDGPGRVPGVSRICPPSLNTAGWCHLARTHVHIIYVFLYFRRIHTLCTDTHTHTRRYQNTSSQLFLCTGILNFYTYNIIRTSGGNPREVLYCRFSRLRNNRRDERRRPEDCIFTGHTVIMRIISFWRRCDSRWGISSDHMIDKETVRFAQQLIDNGFCEYTLCVCVSCVMAKK